MRIKRASLVLGTIDQFEMQAAKKRIKGLIDPDDRFLALDTENAEAAFREERDKHFDFPVNVVIVDSKQTVILNTLVRLPPDIEVTCWRSGISGVNPSRYTREPSMGYGTLCMVLMELIATKTFVGHSIEHDLAVCGLDGWMNFIDIANLQEYQDERGRKRRLKVLAHEFLNTAIQKKGRSHDPVIDANVTMQLWLRTKDAGCSATSSAHCL